MGELDSYLERFSKHVEHHGIMPKDKDIIVLASGGKDSNALIVLIEAYRKKHPELRINYLNVLFPQDVYGEDLIGRQGLIGRDLKHFTSIVPSVARDALLHAKEPCRQCKSIRNEEIALYLKDKDVKNIHLLTGHTNDDLMAYFSELFDLNFKTIITDIDFEHLKDITIREEMQEHFSRFIPRITFHNGATVCKPMLPFTTRDVKDILDIGGAIKNMTHCIYSCRRPKRNLFQILDFLGPEEAGELYEKYTTGQLQRALKQHVKNYEEAITDITSQEYHRFLL